MKLSFTHQETIIRPLLNGFALACLCANPLFAMSSEQEHRQHELEKVYITNQTYVNLDGDSWIRTLEESDHGTVVKLTPDQHSKNNGHFLHITKEIYKAPNNVLVEKQIRMPSKAVAFVLGSALLGAAFWYFTKGF